MAEIEEKRWDLGKEREIFEKWLENKDFTINPDSDKETYTIDNPPAYPSGHWHIGAVAGYTLIDVIARTERMKGKEVIFPYCLDRNGLPVERAVEKKYGKSLHEYDREEFIKLCNETINEFSDEIYRIYKKIGISADYDNTYLTDAEEYRKVTQETFIDLWNKGLVYEATRPINWCLGCRTTLADAELEYDEGNTVLHDLTFTVKDSEEQLTIATTRPELLGACKAVIYNPKDDRYKHLQGKKAIVPVYNIEVPILANDYAKMEYGSGILMVCSYGDFGDIELFNKLKLEPVQCIDEFGKMTEAAGSLKGMEIKEARKKILRELEEAKTGEKQVQQRTPKCSRCNSRIEFLPMKEWYVKQIEYLDSLKEMANKMEFHPKQNKKILDNWIDGVSMDWPISRKRYFATEIPLWKCNKCNKWLVPEPGKYYQPWKQEYPGKCECGNENDFTGETSVFDTWMDSSISNLYVSKHLMNKDFTKKTYICDMRPQGRDIVRTWLYYATLRNYHLFKKPAFKHVMIHGMGLDEKGKKMAKSKGNVIDPEPMIEKYGADSFRFWAASETSVGGDFRISEERIAGAGKFLTKLWNVARFISHFDKAEKPEKLNAADEWILSEINALIDKCAKGYNDYNFFIPSNKIKEFLWNTYASHYLEMVKPRAYENDASALYTIHESFRAIMKLIAPVIPFISYEIYQKMYENNVHKELFPEKMSVLDHTKITEKACEFNSMIWKTKKDKGLSLKADISGIKIPEEIMMLKEDLTKMHNLK